MKNFGWIGTWAVTERCNLRCTYCIPPRLRPADPEPVDYPRAIQRIAEIAPKVLNLSGGEPSLTPNLPDILKSIKERWNPFIRIVHNGTQPSALLSSLPWFDRLVVSLDGPGELNRKTRGISGDRVLKGLAEFLEEAEKQGSPPEVVINLVVTTENAPEVRSLAEAVQRINPRIEIAFSALIPTDHPKSIIIHPEIREKFWKEYEKLREEGFPVWQHFEHFRTDQPVTRVECINQYFTIHFWPDGTPWTCAPSMGRALQNSREYAGKLWKKPNLLPRALKYAVRLFRERLSPGPTFTCQEPCNCESWLDTILKGEEHPNPEYYLRPLYGRFTRDEIEKAVRWIRQYVNPGFTGEVFEPLVVRKNETGIRT